MSGYTREPRCSSGTRSDQRPRLPPTIDGEADSKNACLPLNGCGRNRDTQSIRFFRSPGIDPLYSGDAMTNASFPSTRRFSSVAPGGKPSFACTSWL